MNVPLFAIGFRPFYLGAALFAALSVPIWAATFVSGARWLSLPAAPLTWHGHEMVFGFAPAVIVGFLLTAVRNWSGRDTPSGWPLAALFCWWLAGRLLNLVSPGPISGLVDASFLPAVALVLAVPLWQSRNRRNAFVVIVLLMLGAANTAHHAAIQGALVAVSPTLALTLALDLILILMVVIGGRVIPAFSANAVVGLKPRTWPALEVLAVGLPAAILASDAAGFEGSWSRPLFWSAAAVHVSRLLGWQAWKTWRNPLLLALPLAYGWIPVHFVLRAELPAVATHALTVGAMASLMLAMMTRSALGHTGRPLRAGAAELVCFLAIHLAAVCRVFGASLSSHNYTAWIVAGTAFWTLAFGTFAVAYWSILTRPRVDTATTG